MFQFFSNFSNKISSFFQNIQNYFSNKEQSDYSDTSKTKLQESQEKQKQTATSKTQEKEQKSEHDVARKNKIADLREKKERNSEKINDLKNNKINLIDQNSSEYRHFTVLLTDKYHLSRELRNIDRHINNLNDELAKTDDKDHKAYLNNQIASKEKEYNKIYDSLEDKSNEILDMVEANKDLGTIERLGDEINALEKSNRKIDNEITILNNGVEKYTRTGINLDTINQTWEKSNGKDNIRDALVIHNEGASSLVQDEEGKIQGINKSPGLLIKGEIMNSKTLEHHIESGQVSISDLTEAKEVNKQLYDQLNQENRSYFKYETNIEPILDREIQHLEKNLVKGETVALHDCKIKESQKEESAHSSATEINNPKAKSTKSVSFNV